MLLKKMTDGVRAFALLLIHPAAIGAMYGCMAIGLALPKNPICSFIGDLLAFYYLIVFLLYPFLSFAVSVLSIRYHILAMKNGGSRIAHVLGITLALLLQAAVLLYFYKLWERSMGV